MYVLHNHHKHAHSPEIATPPEAILEEVLSRNALQSLIFIVPTGRRVRLLKRCIVRNVFKRTGKPVAAEMHVYTLEQFAKLCAERLLGNRTPRLVSEAMTAALMEEAADAARHKLSFFTNSGTKKDRAKNASKASDYAISPAVLERLQSIILGLKEDGITPQSLRADVEAQNEHVTDPRRLADIATLYESYEQVLGTTLTDYPKLLNLVIEEITQSRTTTGVEEVWRTLFPAAQMLLLDGFTEFKKPEERFLAAMYHAPFETRIVIDYSDKNGPLFGGLQDTVTNLQGFTGMKVDASQKADEISLVPRYTAFTTDLDTDKWREYKREEHLPKAAYVRRWLFNTEEDIRHAGLNEVVTILSSPTRSEEVRDVAKLLRHYAVNENIPLHEMCVVMRRAEDYAGLFREMCALYDIPANITDRFPLEKSPVVTAVFAVLDMLLYGYRRADVNRALQSPYVRFVRKERGRRLTARSGAKQETTLDAANLFTVAGRLRITGGQRFGRDGKSQWLRRMESRLGYLSKREILLNNSPNADADELQETRRFIEEIELAKRDFIALTSLFPRETTEFTPKEFHQFITEELLATLRVHEQIVTFHKHAQNLAFEAAAEQNTAMKRMTKFLGLEEEIEKDARALTAFVDIIDEMTAILHERDKRFMEAAKAQKRPLSEKYIEPDAGSGTASRSGGKRRSLSDYIERLRTAVRNGRYQVREKLGYGVTITSLEQIRGVPFRLTVICGAVDGEFPMSYVPETFLGKELLDSEDRFLRRERIQFYQALMNNAVRTEDGSKRVFITYPERTDKGDNYTRSPFVDALLKITSLTGAGKIFANGVNAGLEGERATATVLPYFRALASEEETVRHAALSFVEAFRSNPQQFLQNFSQSPLLQQYTDILPSETAKQALERVSVYLAARLEQEEKGETPDNRVDAGTLGKSVYSISALEQYAKCAYQFFASKSLRLREIQQFESSLSPLESGSLLHTILYKFYQKCREEAKATPEKNGNMPVLQPLKEGLPELIPILLDPTRSEEYRARLHKIAEEEIASIRFEHPFFELDRESLVGTNPEEPLEFRRSGKLDVWLESELQRVQEGWGYAPALVEFAFGEIKSVLGNVELAENLRLHGKIDRIELAFDDNGTPHEFLIGDYKSGANVSSNKDIREGLSLQMPLYAAATEELLRSAYGLDAEASGGVYYVLSPKPSKVNKDAETHSFVMLPKDSPLAKGKKRSLEFVQDRAEMREMMDAAVQQAARYAENIRGGTFNAKPYSTDHCEFCSFAPVCRIKEMQSKKE
ncbi:MAG: hypothetical protein EAZ92_06695 [Candidatus Kapaibacterium sp.]|nr:MAG: hypothetical protein EAZ92_06695 [Candidatus Kapabacteria bacterium]